MLKSIISKSKQRRTINNVMFAPDRNLCSFAGGPEELTLDSICEIWFQPEDYEEIRLQAKKESHNRKDHGADFYISRAYGYTDEKSQEMLIQWTKRRDTLRGLERFVNQDYSRARSQAREKIVKAVEMTQRRLDEQEEQDYDRRANVISEIASTLSREATEFAFMIGSADEKAALFLRTKARRSSMDGKRNRRTSMDSMESRRSSIDSMASRRSSIDSTEPSRRSSMCSQASRCSSVCSTISVDISNHKRSCIPQKIEVRAAPSCLGQNIKVANQSYVY
jgi:sucrose-6-phosphate hydrolase SacC (GH32 family)